MIDKLVEVLGNTGEQVNPSVVITIGGKRKKEEAEVLIWMAAKEMKCIENIRHHEHNDHQWYDVNDHKGVRVSVFY